MKDAKLYDIIRSPIITEKSTALSESGKYVFKVLVSATKPMIKEAVTKIFNVTVAGVNTLNVKGKSKVFKGFKGKRASFKKAVVTLSSGQKIDLTTEV